MATNKYNNPLNNAVSSGTSWPWNAVHNAASTGAAGQWNTISSVMQPGLQSIYQRVYSATGTPGEWKDVVPMSAAYILSCCMAEPLPSRKDHITYACTHAPSLSGMNRTMLEVIFNWDIELPEWDAIHLRKRLMGI